MQVDNLMRDPGNPIYYDSGFMNVLEDHVLFFRNHPTTSTIAIDPHAAYKYEFDLFGLLSEYNIPTYLHWIIMRINGFTSPTNNNGKITSLLIPDGNTIEKIRQSHTSARRIN